MQISIGSDHRGFELKSRLLQLLQNSGHDVSDEGTIGSQSVDYPDFASTVAQRISNAEAERGILICSTGIGMCIAANKFRGVRAAICYDELTAEMSRRHNDANVLCLSGDLLGSDRAARMVDIWLNTPFEGGRHARRVEKILGFDQAKSL